MDQDSYDYTLPKELIAHEPAAVRDNARLFVYDRKADATTFDIFKNIANYLPTPSLMVLNETTVAPARILVADEAGRKVELLILINEYDEAREIVPALSRTKLRVGQYLHNLHLPGERTFTVRGIDGGKYELKYSGALSLMEFLNSNGVVPVPPYIHTSLTESELKDRYQTIFAKSGASAAAPTASLHFTDAVFRSLDARHIDRAHLRLDVGLGTFAKVTDEQISNQELHEEPFMIPHDSAQKIRTAKESGRPVIAVGTTVVRTLESASESIIGPHFSTEDVKGRTKLFIQPGFDFKVVDAMITNFHVPKSSLMMLVDAFLTHRSSKRGIRDLYKIAIEEKFRFYSFGDSMLIL